MNGKLCRLTTEPGEELLPSLSTDGNRMGFLVLRPPFTQIWWKELNEGLERQLFQAGNGHTVTRMQLSPDGAKAYFRVMEGPPPQRQAINAVEVATGQVRRVCDDCGMIMSVAPRGDMWVHETGSRLTRLAVYLIERREKHEVIQHPHFAVQNGRLSPDGKWIAFHLDRGAAGKQIFVAPFRGPTAIEERDWIPVTAADGRSYMPAWGSSGARLYFFADRDSARDLWTQPLDPGTKRPSGSPVEVYRFDDAGLTPLLERPAFYTGLSAGGDRLVLSPAEDTCTISIGRLGDNPLLSCVWLWLPMWQPSGGWKKERGLD